MVVLVNMENHRLDELLWSPAFFSKIKNPKDNDISHDYRNNTMQQCIIEINGTMA